MSHKKLGLQILETGKWPSLYSLKICVNKHKQPPERFIIPIHTGTLVLMYVNCLPLRILILTAKYRQFCLPFFFPGPLKVTLFSMKNNNADCPCVEVLNVWAHVTLFPIPGWGIYNSERSEVSTCTQARPMSYGFHGYFMRVF